MVELLPLLWVPWIFISGGRIATHRSRTSLIELSIMHAELSYDYTSILTFTGVCASTHIYRFVKIDQAGQDGIDTTVHMMVLHLRRFI